MYFSRFISPRNGDSPNGIARITKVCANPEYFNLMVPTLNICPTMDLYLTGARFKLIWLVCKPSIGRKIKKSLHIMLQTIVLFCKWYAFDQGSELMREFFIKKGLSKPCAIL